MSLFAWLLYGVVCTIVGYRNGHRAGERTWRSPNRVRWYEGLRK